MVRPSIPFRTSRVFLMATCPSAAAVEKYFPWHTNRTYIQRDAEIMQARQAQREELVKVARLLMAPLVRLEGASGSGRSVFHCEELQHRLAFISQEQVQQGYVPAPPPAGFFGLATGAPAAAPEPAAAPMNEFTPEKAPPPCPRKCGTRLVPHGRASGPRSQHLRPPSPAVAPPPLAGGSLVARRGGAAAADRLRAGARPAVLLVPLRRGPALAAARPSPCTSMMPPPPR